MLRADELNVLRAAAAPHALLLRRRAGAARGPRRRRPLTLNRPKALNALSPDLVASLVEEARALDADPAVGAIVLTGAGDKAFAAGADIKVMQSKSYAEMVETKLFGEMDDLKRLDKPVIAAVNGFALGGGCELAMACDFILAADSARFGQPEIKLGTIPGLGGTQRFARALGKARAMELVLTGDMMSAEEARERGLVARVVAADLLADALATGEDRGDVKPIVAMASAASTSRSRRRSPRGCGSSAPSSTRASPPRTRRSMKAFVAKEAPVWKHIERGIKAIETRTHPPPATRYISSAQFMRAGRLSAFAPPLASHSAMVRHILVVDLPYGPAGPVVGGDARPSRTEDWTTPSHSMERL